MNNDRDSWTVDAMEARGGSFVKALGDLARRADNENLAKIKTTWPEYWSQYEKIGMEMEQAEAGKEPEVV